MHSVKELELEVLRQKVEALNWELLNTLSLRKECVHKIQSLKDKEHIRIAKYPHYDWEREVLLFKKFDTVLATFSLKQLLIFSLIIEEQAQLESATSPVYPEWSKFQHLENKEKGSEQFPLEYQINPLLLYFAKKELAKSLPLSLEFSFLKQFILGE